MMKSINEQFVWFDFFAQYKCTINAASNSLQIGKTSVTRNPTYRNDATCRILVSEDIVLPPFRKMVVKGELVGETSMANGLL